MTIHCIWKKNIFGYNLGVLTSSFCLTDIVRYSSWLKFIMKVNKSITENSSIS